MERKLPALTAESRAFWQGGAEGQLLIHHCGDCARFFHPPAPICPVCLGENIVPSPVQGTGQVMSFTINHQKWRPELDVPYVVAIVELTEQEGLRLVTNIVNSDPQDIHVGMPVKVLFIQQEDVWIPLFEAVE
jgi:uncharacterized OB-fold protein